MKQFLFIFLIIFSYSFTEGQTISGELYDGGLYGSDASSDMTTTLTASSQYSSGSSASPTIFVYRILQTEWDASGVTSVSIVDNPLDMGNGGAPDAEWDDANGYHYLYYSAGVADWDLHDCPTSLGANSTYLSLKFNGLSSQITVYMTLKDVDPVVGSEVNLVTVNQLTSVGSITLGTLPLNLISFSASKYNTTSSYLSWTTSDEFDFDRFEVERSVDSRNWEYVASVESFSFQRNNDYSYLDKDVYNGDGEQTFYYRLKLIDKDGAFRYSDVKFVTFDSEKVEMTLFPNPSSDKVYFSLAGFSTDKPVNVAIYDFTGKLVFIRKIDYRNNNILLLDNAKVRLKSGMYHVVVSDNNDHKLHRKLVIAK